MGFAATKGDLIVLGDFNADGKFDGEDLRRMARGTALADTAGSNTLSGSFADKVRSGVLRKNAALDWMNANATAQQRGEASVDGIVGTADDANAFNKLDVNRDGKIDRVDAAIVDHFVGSNVASLMLGRIEDAQKDLANPVVGNQNDAQLWRALAFARQGKLAQARDAFRSVEGAAIGTIGRISSNIAFA